jgi:hypothetical protein
MAVFKLVVSGTLYLPERALQSLSLIPFEPIHLKKSSLDMELLNVRLCVAGATSTFGWRFDMICGCGTGSENKIRYQLSEGKANHRLLRMHRLQATYTAVM